MPSSPTSAQSHASRHNGAHSAGPKTDSGKQRSAANATRHGLRAERLQLSADENRFADELRHSLAGRALPNDAAEQATLEALIVCEIKLTRLDLLEMRALDEALLDGEADHASRLPSLSTLDRYRGRIMRERRELETRLETLKQTRSRLTGPNAMQPEALRYLADLAERKATHAPANENCTIEPEHSPIADQASIVRASAPREFDANPGQKR